MSPEIKKIIISTLMELRPKEIAIFGSHARGDHRPDSDIDILVEYHEAPDFFQIARTIFKFKKLNLNIDLVDSDGVTEEFLNNIHDDKQIIYRDVRRSA
jgi:hypothetical protein